MTRPAILIHGPTASGKTELSIQLAQDLCGEIVNADAMQVYRDLRIITARPSDEDMARAPHHLFGVVDGAIRYSTGEWRHDVAARIQDIQRRGRVPIVIGGTGLYLSALTEGLSDMPDIPDDARGEAWKLVDASTDAAHDKLAQIDPSTAQRLKPGDGQRIARALEVWFATGQPISAFQTPKPPDLRADEWIGVALTPRRSDLYQRIDARFEAMVESGALEEVRALYERRLDPSLPIMKAHGVPGFQAYFDGLASLETAISRAQRDTRRYAKRQFTWIANQFPHWARIPSEDLETRVGVVSALFAEIDAAMMKR
ncbi:MAG: tRNA (adenosine(37)-N6)-dimethylallyltransferase MiaA [Pseudomonadota bacterium]